MRDDPVDVVKAICISDATLQKIERNLVWAFGYNTTLIPFRGGHRWPQTVLLEIEVALDIGGATRTVLVIPAANWASTYATGSS